MFLEFWEIVEEGEGQSKESSFYIFGVFVDSSGGRTLINVFLRVYFDVFRQKSCFIFRPSIQMRIIFIFSLG